MARITEEQLILPALFLMDNTPLGTITTSELIEKLTGIFKPTGEDVEILAGRNDTKFSQIVRNLKAHNTFEKYGYAKYEYVGVRGGFFSITNKGRKYLRENINIVMYLLNNNFKSEDLKSSFETVFLDKKKAKTIQTFDENIVINEGTNRIVSSKVYERSVRLRMIAIEHYTKNGKIICESCCLDFEEFYGNYGKGFIEIHHQKPVFKFENEDINRTITSALSNVIPVCSNCHRMIHRDRDNPLTIMQIKALVSKQLTFCK